MRSRYNHNTKILIINWIPFSAKTVSQLTAVIDRFMWDNDDALVISNHKCEKIQQK